MASIRPLARFAAALLATILVGCNQPGQSDAREKASDPALPYRTASASEVFALRSKCAALGEQIADEDAHGPGLNVSATSHYDPRTNRCYVEMDSEEIENPVQQNMHYLYDGQTKEMLAYFGVDKGQERGFIFGPSPQSPGAKLTPFQEAAQFVTDKMADDRNG